MNFTPFPKIPRLKRDIVITEKIDGSNAQIVIMDCQDERLLGSDIPWVINNRNGLYMAVGSRSRWIRPGKTADNYGFAAWVEANAYELFELGIGQHFGEWYGKGIQRGYGLDDKRFALFNVGRWNADNLPSCCEVVPTLYSGAYSDVAIDKAMDDLRENGSRLVPGFSNPEGVVVFHSAGQNLYKALLENDGEPKGLLAA